MNIFCGWGSLLLAHGVKCYYFKLQKYIAERITIKTTIFKEAFLSRSTLVLFTISQQFTLTIACLSLMVSLQI